MSTDRTDEPALAWCTGCREDVELEGLRPWPGGSLLIGNCPQCGSTLAVRRPVGWTPDGPGDLGAVRAS